MRAYNRLAALDRGAESVRRLNVSEPAFELPVEFTTIAVIPGIRMGGTSLHVVANV